MLCPKCKKDLVNIYEEGLGWFPHYTGNGDREYQVFVVGHCEKCKSDWQWKDVDFMREWCETDPVPAFQIDGKWVCTC